MREPKEPKSFKHPRMYMLESAFVGSTRLRIIYPDGNTEVSGSMLAYSNNGTFEFAASLHTYNYGKGCWNKRGFKNGKQALRAMRAFDIKEGNQKAIFIGEIK